jgi:two-component system CheB/CheR fusion protein
MPKRAQVPDKARSRKTPAAVVDVGAPGDADVSADNPSGTSDNLDAVIPPHSPDALPIVGLGGSAGAIAALREFFSLMPPDSGMAFVVVIHLSPDYESTLPEVLQAKTTMPVIVVNESVRVEANHVYVIPPHHYLAMEDGHIHLSALNLEKGKRVAVDLFFRTLGDTHGTSAIGIILSGADGDGSIGLKRIKERGGLTIAQVPEEAEHQSMPRNAISTGMVDWVLPVGEMPARLLEFQRNEKRLRLPPEATAPLDEEQQHVAEQEYSTATVKRDEDAMREVLALLKARTGHDFTYYKRATILRRIGRRLQVSALQDIPAYLDFLRTNPGEAGALLNDLLISVTNFFRDADAFEALREAIPKLFRDKKREDQVRVWVAGCATGEEAYSVAMLLHEYAAQLDAPPSLLVFATDISEDAIQAAREAAYPETISADVSPERLRRFFAYDNGCYRVRKELRETVLFAAHDLLKDSPFSRLDLVTCRNLLIYLNHEAQTRVFETFHFALREEGLLFLGSSESTEDTPGLYSSLDKKHKLYARRAMSRVVVPPLPLPAQRALKPLSTARHRDAGVLGVRSGLYDGAPERRGKASLGQLHYSLLELFAPPSVLVNEDYEVLHLSESAGQYLQFSGGEPSSNLLKIVHPDLRLELSTALFTCTQRGEAVRVTGVPLSTPLSNGNSGKANGGKSNGAKANGAKGDGVKAVDIHVHPAPAEKSAQRLMLVLFEESGRRVSTPQAPKAEPITRQMDEELQRLKAQLHATAEQYGASIEELKASNEELQAMNEEARSTSEELETSREELQSVNEELITVNQELKFKVEELAHSNSDLQNLMISTDIATIFLDRTFHIRRYTPRVKEIFNIIPTDVDRSLFDLTHHLKYSDLSADVREVLQRCQPVEREMSTDDGRWFLARLLPYQAGEEHGEGVVLTFLDITTRKRHEANLLFLTEIHDDYGRHDSAEAIMQAAAAKLGAYLNLSLCVVAEVDQARDEVVVTHSWHREGAKDMPGAHGISKFLGEEFGRDLRAGNSVVVRDTQADPRTAGEAYAAHGIGSFVSVPFQRNGQWKFLLKVCDSRPRDWREDEIELVREVTNRIFPRLERALRHGVTRERRAFAGADFQFARRRGFHRRPRRAFCRGRRRSSGNRGLHECRFRRQNFGRSPASRRCRHLSRALSPRAGGRVF